jgi:hypothetical protein
MIDMCMRGIFLKRELELESSPRVRACARGRYGILNIIAVEGWWIVFGARMFVTSQTPFFPNQQYKALCTLIYTLN